MPSSPSPAPAEAGPRRLWSVAVLFGVVSALVLGGIVVLATRSDSSSGVRGSGTDASRDLATEAGSGGEDPAPVDVVLLGDSITEQADPLLAARLGADRSVWIDGRSGFTVVEQMPAAQQAARLDPAQVVVNLGTNDVTRRYEPVDSVARLRAMLDLFPGARCLHVVTLAERMVYGRQDMGAPAQAFNEELRALAATDPRVTVIEWEQALRREEAAGTPPEDLLYDTIHPTDRGKELLADLYADALADCPVG